MKATVVGSGLSGTLASRLLSDCGVPVRIMESSSDVGGNCRDTIQNGTQVHQYGPHLFHTNDDEVWDFLSRFTEWTPYRHKVAADTGLGRISIPYNHKTSAQLGHELSDDEIRNLIFVDYSEKQWGVPWGQLPAAIKGRVPTRRNSNDDGYFTDKYQAQPNEGYSKMFERILESIPVHLGVGKDEWRKYTKKADLVIYTGKIDEYFNNCYGRLPYRSLRFEHFWSPERLPHAVINQCNRLPYTRIYDHRYFSEQHSPGLPAVRITGQPDEPLLPAGAIPLAQAPKTEGGTIITREYPKAHDETNEPYYPMPFGAGMALYQKYKKLADAERNTIFIGRLATYSYLDMWMAVKQAMVKLRPIVGELKFSTPQP